MKKFLASFLCVAIIVSMAFALVACDKVKTEKLTKQQTYDLLNESAYNLNQAVAFNIKYDDKLVEDGVSVSKKADLNSRIHSEKHTIEVYGTITKNDNVELFYLGYPIEMYDKSGEPEMYSTEPKYLKKTYKVGQEVPAGTETFYLDNSEYTQKVLDLKLKDSAKKVLELFSEESTTYSAVKTIEKDGHTFTTIKFDSTYESDKGTTSFSINLQVENLKIDGEMQPIIVSSKLSEKAKDYSYDMDIEYTFKADFKTPDFEW